MAAIFKLIHTADWHLGQTLHGASRAYEHQQFLRWLLDVLEAEAADALLIAGDVFDTASPPASAQAQYYGFLAQLRARLPDLAVVIIGGNHDSPTRLDAPRTLLDAMGMQVVGGMPHREGATNLEAVLHPIRKSNQILAWVAAVPFLRRVDLPGDDDDADQRWIEGHRGVYQRLGRIGAERAQNVPLVAMGHAYLVGGLASDSSERKIQAGNQQALPTSLFGPEWAYVALGHLHRAQAVNEDRIRYSGSPIPLSLPERSYEHQICVATFEGPRLVEIRPRLVPRAVDLLAVPESHLKPATVLEALRKLERLRPGEPDEARPFLEVRVQLERAEPRLRQDIEAALEGARPRLLRIDVLRTDAPARPQEARALDQLGPLELFRAAYRAARGREPDSNLEALFAELIDEVEQAS